MEKQATIDPQIENEELLRLKQQVASLTDALDRLRADMAQQSKTLADLASRLAGAPATTSATAGHEKPVSPEMLVVMAAAVSTFLGKKIRIRSARMLQSPYEIVNPWSQQGRVSVQASHSLRWER